MVNGKIMLQDERRIHTRKYVDAIAREGDKNGINNYFRALKYKACNYMLF